MITLLTTTEGVKFIINMQNVKEIVPGTKGAFVKYVDGTEREIQETVVGVCTVLTGAPPAMVETLEEDVAPVSPVEEEPTQAPELTIVVPPIEDGEDKVDNGVDPENLSESEMSGAVAKAVSEGSGEMPEGFADLQGDKL